MDVGPLVIPHPKAAKLVEPGKCPLDDPPPPAQTAPVRGKANCTQERDLKGEAPPPFVRPRLMAVRIDTAEAPTIVRRSLRSRLGESRCHRQFHAEVAQSVRARDRTHGGAHPLRREQSLFQLLQLRQHAGRAIRLRSRRILASYGGIRHGCHTAPCGPNALRVMARNISR